MLAPQTRGATSITRPGGAQARVKLGIVGHYLKRFTKASQAARDRIYIDGLAGSGTGIDPRTGEPMTVPRDLPFEAEPPFTEVYLIEKDEARASELEKLRAAHPEAEVICGDVNVERRDPAAVDAAESARAEVRTVQQSARRHRSFPSNDPQHQQPDGVMSLQVAGVRGLSLATRSSDTLGGTALRSRCRHWWKRRA